MEIARLAEIASEKVSSEKNPSPRMYLDRVRRNLMALLCKDEIREITGTVDDFGGKESLTDDVKKAVLNLFCLAEVLKVDLAAGLDAEFGPTAKAEETDRREETGAQVTEKTTPFQSGKTHQVEKEASHCEAAMGTGKPGGQSSEGSHASSANGKENLKETYRKFFRETGSLEQVEHTWKKEIARNKEFDGKDKAELQPDYAAAKKRLSAK